MSQDIIQGENIKDSAQKGRKKPPKRITAQYLHNSGLAYLQRFPASKPHFRRVMMRKIMRSCNYHREQCPENCAKLLEEAIQTFERLGLLDDASYLKGMVTSLRGRGLSTQAILAKLTQKGLTQEEIRAALEIYDEDYVRNGLSPELRAAALLARRKKLGPFSTLAREDRRKDKELAAMARAGFSYDIASRALEMDREAAEAVLDGRSPAA
ncbi:MAG: regulatory protein RecX [Micavibrio sp.]